MWRRILAILTLTCCLSQANAATSQTVNYWAEAWGDTTGLRQNTVTAILQSREGYLWLGTPRGLVRSDGVQFKLFDSATVPTLRDQHDHITALVEDGDGALWVGTKQGGVLQLKDGVFTALGSAAGLTDLNVSALCLDSSGRVWVGTDSGGLFQIRNGEFISHPVLGEWSGHRPKTILGGVNDRLWIATMSQFGILEDGELRLLAEHPAAGGTVDMGLSANGGVWVTADGQLFKYDGDGKLTLTCGAFMPESLRLARVTVTSVTEDRQGQVWIGTYGQGIYRYFEGEFTRIKDDKGENDVQVIREDREGNIWIGTRGAKFGLQRLRSRLIDVIDFDPGPGLRAPVVTSECESKSGGIWVGTDGGGLYHWRDGKPKRFNLEGGGDHVWAVMEDTQTNLWVGTESGLFRIGQDGQTNFGLATLSLSIRALHEDKAGNIWAGTSDSGICRISAEGFRQFTERDGLANNDVRSIQSDDSGGVWIGTAQGLSLFAKDRFKGFTATNGLPSDFIRTLYAEKLGPLWVGTGRGLACYHQGRWAAFTTRNAGVADDIISRVLPDDIISQIIDDNRGNLWIGCNRGIIRLKKWELLAQFKNPSQKLSRVLYGPNDGLKTALCNGGFHPSGLLTSNGRMCFPTLDGLAVIDLSNLAPNERIPTVLIESLKVNGKEISMAGPIRLPPGPARFEFAYTGFNYSAPRRLKFRYMIEGVDPDWVDGQSGRLAVYPADPADRPIPSGTYKFKVIAGNDDGKWNEIGKSLEFTILTPFWQTKWFLGLAAMLFVALGLSAYRYIAVLQLRRKLRELEQQQVLERERARIAKDVHDDLGARLTQIGIIGELIRRDATTPAGTELAGKLTRAAREVSESVDEIVWAVNPRNDTLDRLVPYLLNFADEFLEPTSIHYRLDAPANLPPQPIKSDARHNLFLVFKELRNNAVKHSRAAELTVTIRFEKEFTLEVTDDGCGFEIEHARPMGNGLVNMRKRIEEIGGTFEVTSTPGQGTRTRIALRLK